MKLLTKLSLIFLAVFGLGLAAVAYISHDRLQSIAREHVLDQARMIAATAASMRKYTQDHVKKSLKEASGVAADREPVFHPETVPAFAATELFGALRDSGNEYSDYSYKEATLNPTNPRDRAADWEADVINTFRNDPKKDLISNSRNTPTGTTLFIARPLVALKGCLECHSTPSAAPASLIKQYGPANGFGWKENEIIGAQIVSVPVSKAVELANHAFAQLIFSFVLVGILTLLILDLVLYFTVIRALKQFATSADQISKGQMDVPEVEAKGKDEISVLAAAFNRMHRSLVAAMRLLERGE